jgi:tyrosine-specific transport protein
MLIPSFYVIKLITIHPKGSHLITLAKSTLGIPGVVVIWLCNCFLLYVILAAYISAGGDLVYNYLKGYDFFSFWLSTIIFTVVMAGFVIPGTRVTSMSNAIFMMFKAGLFFVLVGIMIAHTSQPFINDNYFPALQRSVLVVVASFTNAMIIPTLYMYLNYNLKQLKGAIIAGSAISLFIYFLWIIAVHLVVPLHGPNGLLDLAKHNSVYVLARAIGDYTHFPKALVLANGFVSACLLTTFLGVSLCLSDVIADGTRLRKKGWGGVLVYLLTYIPPVVVVLFSPKIFVLGVNYAGLTAVVYVVIMPAMMIYSARFKKSLLENARSSVFFDKPVISFVLFVGAIFFIVGLANIITG